MARSLVLISAVSRERRNVLVQMADYRDRLTLFFYDVTPEQLHDLLQHDVMDIGAVGRDVGAWIARLP